MSAVLVRGGGRSTRQFSLRPLEVIDLCTFLWYTQYRSDKQERLVIFVAVPTSRGSRSALAANIEAS
jgi:hypothetical protein